MDGDSGVWVPGDALKLAGHLDNLVHVCSVPVLVILHFFKQSSILLLIDGVVQVIQVSGCLIELTSGDIGFMQLKPMSVATVVGSPEFVLGLGKQDDVCYAIRMIPYFDEVLEVFHMSGGHYVVIAPADH